MAYEFWRGCEFEVKNVSFMQLVLGVAGGVLIYSGIKDMDIVGFFGELVRNPKQAFNQGWLNAKTGGPTRSSTTTPATPNNPPATPNNPFQPT